MKFIKPPQQTTLFDSYSAVFDEKTRNELDQSWPGLFRHVILEQLPAKEMAKHFQEDDQHIHRSTYKDMVRVFSEQCEVDQAAIRVRKNPGGEIMVNPSDPDATYDGHKGAGYQAQLAETCHPDNDTQLITGAIAQTAVESDSRSLEPMIDQLEANDLKPEQLVADTAYCSDDNVDQARQDGVELIGPAPSQLRSPENRKYFNHSDFEIDLDRYVVTRCPAGHTPLESAPYTINGVEKIKTLMDGHLCSACPLKDRCNGNFSGEAGLIVPFTFRLYFSIDSIRLEQRRAYEQTEAFKSQYRMRSGIEATNSGLKRKCGLGRLRVRGRPSVFRSIYLKVAGWNMFRASGCAKIHKEVKKRASQAFLWHAIMRVFRLWHSLSTLRAGCLEKIEMSRYQEGNHGWRTTA